MTALASILIAASGAILLALGLIHVFITYAGRLLLPRDRALRERMEAVSPVISRDTTMWRAWQGFNASHGLGVMLFGVVYIDLALRNTDLLARDVVLQGIGLAWLLAWVLLAVRHWFNVPQAGTVLATLLYAAGLVALHT
jgi:hypothetical protein